MSKFSKGVSYYTIFSLTDKVGFPEKDICCKWCKYYDRIPHLDRLFCRVTGETIYSPDTIHTSCPLKMEEEK